MVDTTSTLTNSIRTRYQNEYESFLSAQRVYDRFAKPVGDDMSKFINGNQITIPFISKMNIGTTAISETSDLTPQTLVDADVSVTPTSRGEVLQQSELLRIQNYAENFEKNVFKVVRENALESIDLVSQGAMLKGDLFFRAAARASLDGGTSGHRLIEATFTEASNYLSEFKVDSGIDAPTGKGKSLLAVIHGDQYHDLRASGNIVEVAKYQRADIIMAYELGSLGAFRIIVAPWSKVFGGAGVDNDSNAATTLSSAATKLDKTIGVASASNITVGRYITIGTEETGSTHYETNERVKVSSADGTTISIIGQGANGGLRHNHASGVAVRNAHSVYPAVFGYKGSIEKWWDPKTGEFGKLVLNETQGLVKQWMSDGWKWYGQYARIVENRLVRAETSSSLDD